jgi:two-component system cell cycle response regulator
VPSSPPASLGRLAVVDDDKLQRERLASMLRSEGYTVHALEGAGRLLDMHQRKELDLVLLDVVLEGLSGIDCCRILKASGSFLPVILLTSRSDPDSRLEGLRIGADDYLAKPFDMRELLLRVAAFVKLKRTFDQTIAQRDKLRENAIVDELTGLYNVRYLQTRLAEEWKRAERHHEPLSVAFIDVDHLSAVNEKGGHEMGDQVLREIGVRLRSAVREIDVLTRYGGEEFVVLLPSTHLSGALTVAQRISHAVADKPIDSGAGGIRVTVSIGISLYPSPNVGSRDLLLRAADRALQRAKDEGDGRICVAREPMMVVDG